MKIYEGGNSGELLFEDGDWIPICRMDKDAGVVACRQLGYGSFGGLLSYEVSATYAYKLYIYIYIFIWLAITDYHTHNYSTCQVHTYVCISKLAS